MKYTRLIIGILLVLGAIWVILGEQISGASSNAYVNAQLVTLRSERAGKLVLPSRALGSAIAKGEPVGEMTDIFVDSVRLNDLGMEKSRKAAEIVSHKARLAALTEARAEMQARSETYQDHRAVELAARLRHARERLTILEQVPATTAEELVLAEAASEGTDWIPGAPALTALAIEHARERVAVLETELEAAKAAVFLGDGYNDAPYSDQRIEQIDTEIALEASMLEMAKSHLAAIEERRLQESLRVRTLSSGILESPVNGLYWQGFSADGVTVQRGDPVMQLVDCESIVVSLSVSESVYNSLELGQPATFRFIDQSRTYSGQISRLAGSGAADVYKTMAVAPSGKHLERYDVTVTVPELLTDTENPCALGRTGRVFFERRPLDVLRRIFG